MTKKQLLLILPKIQELVKSSDRSSILHPITKDYEDSFLEIIANEIKLTLGYSEFGKLRARRFLDKHFILR